MKVTKDDVSQTLNYSLDTVQVNVALEQVMQVLTGGEVPLYSFFNLGTRSGWVVLTPRPGRFTPGKETRYPLYRRLDGAQGRSGRMGKTFAFYQFLHKHHNTMVY
jgi:hypothetical protein